MKRKSPFEAKKIPKLLIRFQSEGKRLAEIIVPCTVKELFQEDSLQSAKSNDQSLNIKKIESANGNIVQLILTILLLVTLFVPFWYQNHTTMAKFQLVASFLLGKITALI